MPRYDISDPSRAAASIAQFGRPAPFSASPMIESYNQALQMSRLAPQMAMIQQLMGALTGMMGMSGPANKAGGFEQFFDPIQARLLASAAPGEGRARTQLTNQITAQGGDMASGASQAAMGNLEGELAGVRSGMLGQAMLGVLGPWMSQRTALMQALMGSVPQMMAAANIGGGSRGGAIPAMQSVNPTGMRFANYVSPEYQKAQLFKQLYPQGAALFGAPELGY